MGRPKITSFDSLITYPFVKKTVPYFTTVHPNWITLVCIYIKYVSIVALSELQLDLLAAYMILERYLDCLDGEVARTYHKTSQIGNYLDKYSDLVYRIYMILYCVYYSSILMTPSVYWILLSSLTLICPLLYLLDWKNGLFDSSMDCSGHGVAIYLEDNASLLCFLLPWTLSQLLVLQTEEIYT